MKRLALLTTFLFLAFVMSAQVIDFESTGLSEGDVVTDLFCISEDEGECCITFSVGEYISPGVYNITGDPILARVDSPRFAFEGAQNNTTCGTSVREDMVSSNPPTGIPTPGCFFLVDTAGISTINTVKSIIIDYSKPIYQSSGQLLDLDNLNQFERFEVTALQNNGGSYTPVNSISVDHTDNIGGDGGTSPYIISSTMPFDRVAIRYTGTKHNVGFALDNISYCITTPPCNADFTYCYNTADKTFTFNANDMSGNHFWSFGDGSPQVQGSSVQHIYTAPGTYEVCHYVQGEKQECEKCITICITEQQIGEERREKNSGSKEEISKSDKNTKTPAIQSLYPNPSEDQISLDIQSPKATSVKLKVFDNSGKVVSSQEYDVKKGSQEIKHDFAELKTGIYRCQIKIGNNYSEEMFIVH